MDVVVWLRGLGLGKYEAAFRENEIDETVLPSLTHENLKELGVTALGHRLKLLDAIAALRTDKGAKAPSSDAAATSSAPMSPEGRAERRQVTVMFSDLVGSTALSARIDPEDLREVISAYQKCVAETIRRFGGFVAKYLGDGVLVYFGYPEAHEDDAERAVRAGLELIAALAGLKTHASLQTRIGIATGLVVVGDLVGSGEAQERGIVGETPNLAARLQGTAEPNTVVIGEGTRKLLGTLFELEDLGPKDLKGIAGPVHAWAALRASSVESRFEALHAVGLTSDAIQMFTSWIGAYRSTGATIYMPLHLSLLARANAELGQFPYAWRYRDEAMTAIDTTKESWFEAEANRIAGEIALLSPDPDAAKAEAYFERALAVAGAQQAKSWELRAAMSLARLWRHQGKPQRARELLAPIYGWFTEGFETRDLKEAKTLLDALSS